MPRPAALNPTDRELEILQVLWASESASLGEIRERLSAARPVAATTVATLLKIMEEKGLASRAPGRRWQATISRTTASRGLLDRLLDLVFDGSAGRLVAHVVESRPLSDAEIDELRELLDRSRTSQRSNASRRRPR